jgi:[protein-PII] uridylyltransferase
VQEHRSLYYWATQRDLHDPETVSEVVRIVGSKDRLGDLFLVTVAALSTINPKAMTSWKARMLEDLYFKLVNHFEGRAASARSERIDAIRAEVSATLEHVPGAHRLEAFVASMPERYLLAHDAAAILRHAQIARDRGGRDLVVEVSPGPDEELHELVVLTRDRPGLLADVAAVLTAHRLAIVSAEVYTRAAHEEAFDVFLVRRSERADRQPLTESHRDRIQADLAARLAGEVSADALLARYRGAPAWAVRPTPDVPTEVTVDNEASLHHTIVDVFTRDRPGLLHVIARTLREQGLTISSCKVNTEGERVADVFYVRDAVDGKLRQTARLAGLQEALLDNLREFHDAATGGA